MDILHLDAGREMRGGQFQVLHLLRGLAARGHNVKLLGYKDGPARAVAQAEGIPTGDLSRSSLRDDSRNVDLVHAHDARSHGIGVLSSRAPLVVARRVAFPVQRNPFSRWKYRRAAHFIAVSRAVAAELLAASIDPARISVVPDGVVVPDYVSPYESRPWPAIVMAPETDDPAKGSDLARATVVLCGLELQFSAKLADDLERARLFLYLSRQEGLGSAALLAMARGLAVVASNVGGLPEVVEHEVTGLITENEPTAIASALTRLAEDRALASRMAAAGRERVIRQFSVDAMVDSTVDVYKQVLAATGPGRG